MTDLDERLTLAFADLFAENRIPLWDGTVSGGPGYYGVHAAAAEGGAEVELTVTFRAGVRYCCFEYACHADYQWENWWVRMGLCLSRHGLGHLPLPIIRTFQVVIERGAVAQPGIVDAPETCFVWEAAQYQTGPWLPIRPSQAGPVG